MIYNYFCRNTYNSYSGDKDILHDNCARPYLYIVGNLDTTQNLGELSYVDIVTYYRRVIRVTASASYAALLNGRNSHYANWAEPYFKRTFCSW